MKKQVIRVGSVGLGEIWNGVHQPGIARSEQLQLTAICDIDREKLDAVGTRLGIEPAYRFIDYRDLIGCPQVDAVDISTPNDCHYEIALAAVKEEKPYCVEKPVTMTAQEAEVLEQAGRECGVKSMVCFSYRFKAAARYARDLILHGKIGDLYHVNAQYFQSWGLPKADCPLVWRYVKEKTGSGALGDLGCHVLDLVRFITGREYQRVVSHTGTFVKQRRLPEGEGFGKVDVDDFCNYMAEMEQGLSASFQITRFAFGRGNYQRVEFYGSKGAIVYQLDATPGCEDEIEVCEGEINEQAHVFSRLPVPQCYKSDQMQSLADILLDIGDGLAARIEDGVKNQKVVDALLQSADKKCWIDLIG